MELAQNIWSSWDPDAYRLFSRINPVLFRKFNHNPVKLLQKVSESRLNELSKDVGFINELNMVHHKFKTYLKYEGHYLSESGENKPFEDDFVIAYYSMEYGLQESLPIYSGGLGVLSGDYLKAASDLGMPLIAFGLLYRYGYFIQKINIDGMQEEVYEENEWYSKPVQIVKDERGNDLIVELKVAKETIYLKAWKINVGKIDLYLLDTDIEKNDAKHRRITDHLYVSDKEMRLLQEIVLAFGSLELMEKLDIKPTIHHMNEGHSAFLIIKRLKQLMSRDSFSFDKAVDLIKASTVFTTHTPVPAGNETFEMDLVEQYMSAELAGCNISFAEFKNFAAMPDQEGFSMPALAIRFSCYVNGVSKLHSLVSKKMWHPIYPQLYEDEMPIEAITNGVHIQSWLSRNISVLFNRYLGPNYLHTAEDKSLWENIFSIPDNEIWEAHQTRKAQMINFIRSRLKDSLVVKGAGESSAEIVSSIINLNYLTIGFARRFASYKRANLLLQDKNRLLRLLNHSSRPIQFIFAGKAHPADEKGKAAVKELIDFAHENKVEDRFVFIEDYDINVARHLVQGVDVWLNNPQKPNEASGTSGMKAGINGVLNCSVLDGWWPECYHPKNGWAIKSYESVSEKAIRDDLEASELYDILEYEIAKLYYNKDQNGLPHHWVEMMKQSIHDVGRGFNMHRMLREYLDKFYLTSFANLQKIYKNDFAELSNIQELKKEIADVWDKIKIEHFEIEIEENKTIVSGEKVKVNGSINLGKARAEIFTLELFYRYNNHQHEIIPLEFEEQKNNTAYFQGELIVKGAGRQSFNLRVCPKPYLFKRFREYVRWYY